MDKHYNLNIKYIKKIDKLIKENNESNELVDSIRLIDFDKLQKNLHKNDVLIKNHLNMVSEIISKKNNLESYKDIKEYIKEYLEKTSKFIETNVKILIKEDKNMKKEEIELFIKEINTVLQEFTYKPLMEKFNLITFPKDMSIPNDLKEFMERTKDVEELENPIDIYELKRLLVKTRITLENIYELNDIEPTIKKEPKKEIIKNDLKYFEYSSDDTFENTQKHNEMNRILNVFHSIAKPHIDSKSQPTILSEKEIGILNVMKRNLGNEEFTKLKIKWNPYVGLFVESKDGFDKDNQKLIMSHTDLVTTFQKSHQEVKEGKRESALTIGSDGLIRGSLDNTLPNAIVLYNFVNNKFDSNVSILFDRGEESGMWGSSNFHEEKEIDKWFDLELNMETLKLSLKETTHPVIKQDLITINTDVTMPDVVNYYTFETRDFSKETDNRIKDLFPDGKVAKYGYDDSASSVKKDMIGMSFCLSVGTSISQKDGKYCFGGGCHSDNTATTIDNILEYSQTFEPFIKAMGNDIQIEIKKEIEYKNSYSYDYDYKKEFDINNYYKNASPDILKQIEEYESLYADQPSSFDVSKEDVAFEVVRFALNEIDDGLEELNGFIPLNLEEYEVIELFELLNSDISGITLTELSECDSKQDIVNLVIKNITDEELEKISIELFNNNSEEFVELEEDWDASGAYETIGEEIWDFTYHLIMDNTSYHKSEDFDDYMSLELTPYEFDTILKLINERIENVTAMKLEQVDTFNDLAELLIDNIQQKEVDYFVNEYEISTVIEM